SYHYKNYIADDATPGNLKAHKARKRKEAKRKQKEKEAAVQLKNKLAEITVEIKAKAGENGQLFVAITSKHIADTLNKTYGYKIDKRKIELDQTIRSLGYTNIPS